MDTVAFVVLFCLFGGGCCLSTTLPPRDKIDILSFAVCKFINLFSFMDDVTDVWITQSKTRLTRWSLSEQAALLSDCKIERYYDMP
jgi:hypothetical protein